MTKLNNKQQSKVDKELAADRLRQARIDAGFPTATHASVRFGWNIKTYLQHEEGIKSFDAQTALKYSKALDISGDWLSSLCTDCSLQYNHITNTIKQRKLRKIKNKQQSRMIKKVIADRLRQARIDAGYPTANHASVSFGWSTKTYFKHEEAINPLDSETAEKYSKAFRVSSVWLLGDYKDV